MDWQGVSGHEWPQGALRGFGASEGPALFTAIGVGAVGAVEKLMTWGSALLAKGRIGRPGPCYWTETRPERGLFQARL